MEQVTIKQIFIINLNVYNYALNIVTCKRAFFLQLESEVQVNKNHTVMSNCYLSDTRISLKAVGLLSKMLALPATLNYSITGLIAICKENETAIRNTLNELKEYGYLQIIKKKNDKGQFEYEWKVRSL